MRQVTTENCIIPKRYKIPLRGGSLCVIVVNDRCPLLKNKYSIIDTKVDFHVKICLTELTYLIVQLICQ